MSLSHFEFWIRAIDHPVLIHSYSKALYVDRQSAWCQFMEDYAFEVDPQVGTFESYLLFESQEAREKYYS